MGTSAPTAARIARSQQRRVLPAQNDARSVEAQLPLDPKRPVAQQHRAAKSIRADRHLSHRIERRLEVGRRLAGRGRVIERRLGLGDLGLQLAGHAAEARVPRTFVAGARRGLAHVERDVLVRVALGLLARDGAGRVRVTNVPVGEGVTLAISIEPLGGSPKSTPTGPVVATGALTLI